MKVESPTRGKSGWSRCTNLVTKYKTGRILKSSFPSRSLKTECNLDLARKQQTRVRVAEPNKYVMPSASADSPDGAIQYSQEMTPESWGRTLKGSTETKGHSDVIDVTNSRYRKVKTFLPKVESKASLGPSYAGTKFKRLNRKFLPDIRDLRSVLSQRTEKSKEICIFLQSMMLGTTFKTDWIYHECKLYTEFKHGFCRVRKPLPLTQVRLLVEQLARTPSDFPWEIIQRKYFPASSRVGTTR